MERPKPDTFPPLAFRCYFWIPLVVWTAIVGGSLVINLYQHQRSIRETALQMARLNYEKDILYRNWNARHGGVYVEVSPQTQPHPHLAHHPERDVVTPSGRKLTLVNPAYMTRLVYEMAGKALPLRSRTTGLNPLNPERQPDEWEAAALKAFGEGKTEVTSIEVHQGKSYLRLIRPIYAERGCLTCHREKDYRVGEVVGGLSVAVDLGPLREANRTHVYAIWGGHLVMWLLGLGGFLVMQRKLTCHFRLRQQAEEAMVQANEKLTALVYETALQNQQTQMLNEMTEALQCCRRQEEAYKALERILPQLFPEDSGLVYVLEKSSGLMEAVVSWGESPISTGFFEPDDCLALRRGQLYVVSAPEKLLPCSHLISGRVQPYICVPLMAHGELLGILHLWPAPAWGDDIFEGENRPFPEATVQLARRVGEHLSLALANLELRENLRQQAIRDPLTGLFNRRYLELTLERELSRVRRQNQPLAVIMADVDHFKRFNDTYGHEAGDVLLKTVGQFLQSHVRQEDIPCRFGGEEFVLVLPGTSLETAVQRAEELRQGVEKLRVVAQGQALGPITLSLGVAVFPFHGGSPEALLNAADMALYQAKKTGRNRVVAAEPVVSEAPIPSPAPALDGAEAPAG